MVRPILQSIAETDKLERFFVNKLETAPHRHQAVPSAGKFKPDLAPAGSRQRALSGSGFSVYVFVLARFLRLSSVTETLNYGVTWADLRKGKTVAIGRPTAFKGSVTALVTPFQDGLFDETRFRALVDWQIVNGTHGLVPAGTTGESPTLSHEEHRQVIVACVSEARGRVPVIAGAGSNNTHEAIELARFAEGAGADGLLVVTPYYNKPSQEGLYRHFKAVNDAVGIPIIIYNIPPRSVVDMSVDTMKRLYELKNIAGVKDATGNLARTALQRQSLGPDFIQLSGEDMTALAVMAHGGHGCISVSSNVAPELCAKMQGACLRGDFAAALQLHDQLAPLHAALFVEPNPAGPKYALSALGKIACEIRLPMLPASETAQAAIKAAMIHAGLVHA
jgi:4-hydroxy-tetrahydrodipicolinate synthase